MTPQWTSSLPVLALADASVSHAPSDRDFERSLRTLARRDEVDVSGGKPSVAPAEIWLKYVKQGLRALRKSGT